MSERKAPITEAERLELATKLDKELDSFIDNLPKREPGQFPSYDRWEDELEKHPFFMKEAPQPGDDLHPLYEGLQKLKYDPNENEPEELALAYKDDGNFHFKYKKYRMAVISYTEGLKAKSGNVDLDSNLLNNRAAAHYFLKNYRSALLDCEAALKLKPDYEKALIRAANCAHKTGKYQKCLAFCDQLLSKNGELKDILELRRTCLNEQKISERDRRKREMKEKKLEKDQELILEAIRERKIKIEGGLNDFSKLEPQFPQLFGSKVHLDEGQLIWPVILFYPEYKIMDYIQYFNENVTFEEQFKQVFEALPDWDQDKKYRGDNVNLYYENCRRQNVKVDVNSTLLEVLQRSDYVVKEGTPRFILLVKQSRAERQFLAP